MESGHAGASALSRLRPDLVAGLTTAAVVVPKSMAFAAIAGLPVQTGLYVAMVPMLAYSLAGSSPTLSVSSTSTLAMLTAVPLLAAGSGATPAALAAASATLCLLVGAMMLLASLLRLGFIANFISDPVLTGFKAGIALVILADQVPKLLGIHIVKTGYFRDAWAIVQHSADTHAPTLALGAATLLLLYALKKALPAIPGPLAAVLGGVAVMAMAPGGTGIGTVGSVPAGLPALALPDLSLAATLWPAALGIALMSFTESVAAARAFDPPAGPPLRPNRELSALGLANLAGALLQCFPAGGGTSQTAVNARAGARTRAAGAACALAAVGVVLFLAPWLSLLPQVTLAAIVVFTTLPLLNPTDFRSILRVRRMEFAWAIAACLGVMLLGTLQGIAVAVGLSLLCLVYLAANPPVYRVGRQPGTEIYRPLLAENAGDETIPGLLILRTEGQINFASAPQVRERMWALVHEASPKVILIECSAIPVLEYTALRAMAETERKLASSGIELRLCGMNPGVAAVVARSPLGAALGPGRIFPNLREAVRAYEAASGASRGEPT